MEMTSTNYYEWLKRNEQRISNMDKSERGWLMADLLSLLKLYRNIRLDEEQIFFVIWNFLGTLNKEIDRMFPNLIDHKIDFQLPINQLINQFIQKLIKIDIDRVEEM